MKNTVLYILLFLILFSACSKPNIDVHQITLKEQRTIILSIIRYMGHLPKKGSHLNKFDSQFDEYYSKLALDYTLEAYHADSEYEYILTSRVAPSLKIKKIAIGIKLKRDKNGQILFYEEVFRTWKFVEEEMIEKGQMLFVKMIQGKDLSPYYPQNSGKEEYIEFPDERVKFDIKERRWSTISENK